MIILFTNEQYMLNGHILSILKMKKFLRIGAPFALALTSINAHHDILSFAMT